MTTASTRPPQTAAAPADAPELPPLEEAVASTQLSSLSESLMHDLNRVELGGPRGRRELLEVLAASVRHGHAISVRLRLPQARVVLSVFPHQRVLHCTLALAELIDSDMGQWQVEEVLPPLVKPVLQSVGAGHGPVPDEVELDAPWAHLGPLLWAVALAGTRENLLPEVTGQAAYRVAPGATLTGLYMPPALADCVHRLRGNTYGLSDIAAWPGIGPARAQRLINALYLQSALIVSRTHPAATNEGWRGYDEDE